MGDLASAPGMNGAEKAPAIFTLGSAYLTLHIACDYTIDVSPNNCIIVVHDNCMTGRSAADLEADFDAIVQEAIKRG